MKIGILGAGISGLSVGKMLSKEHDVELLERHSIHGGIARTKTVEGVAYHPVGGHCFNSKYPDVMDFVFNEVLPKESWHQVQRNAVIKFKEEEISYPIEYAIQQIHNFAPELAIDITRDFLSAEDNNIYENLEDWFRKKFGNTLAETYFIPYNSKIWNRHPSEMSPAWVDGKLPIPNKESFFKGLISNESDRMPHASFYYPDSNNQNTFIDKLAEGLNILTDFTITSVAKRGEKWLINDEKEYDLVISTLPLNLYPHLIKNTPKSILDAADLLRYNKVTTMFWETEETDRTWTYIPEAYNFFHRYIHIGSFFKPKKNYSMSEVVGEKTKEEMIENGKKDSFLKRPVDYNVSEHAYVVFDENYNAATTTVKKYLEEIGLYTLGRFGEWQYYNMDVCIKSSLDLAASISNISK
ncbi:NAD(P)/FAD-dependent oxidoreductase [Pedobacter sp. Leaf250]|uniref:protoporphyrinogen/coproporphyrinogen oxidase n=1 Tax=Pedobacter sp. Leaf250 TaxID=2876559 RepID=UPI001E62C621|nr:NAD(P)-binding protein [Pedobacter sp. Leaf250]